MRQRILASMIEAQSLSVPWGTQSFRRQGTGKPFVLVHPLALNSRLWEPVVDDFLPDHDLVMPDVRGHGDSRWDGTAYSIEDIARDVRTLLDALGIERCSMLGMSMGGCVAMTFAVQNPERVDRLLLCDTTAWYGADAHAKWHERAHAAMTKTRDEQIPFQMDRWFSESFRREHADIVGHAANVFRSTTREAHAAACRALGEFDLRDRLAAIRAKTLVVTGEADYATPPSMGRALAEAVPGATFALVPDVRHMAVLESSGLRRRLQGFATAI
jgi:3-oxoadipate enol-lactonase